MSNLIIPDIINYIWDFLDNTSKRLVKISSKRFNSLKASVVIRYHDFEIPSKEMILWLIDQKFKYRIWIVNQVLNLQYSELEELVFGTNWNSKIICEKVLSFDNNNALKIMHNNGMILTKNTLKMAIEYDAYKCMIYIITNDFIIDNNHLSLAISFKSWKCIEYILLLNLPKTISIMESAFYIGNLEFIKRLENMEYPLNKELASIAIRWENIEILRYLIEKIELDMSFISLEAAKIGNCIGLKYIYENYNILHPQCAIEAVKYHNIQCLDFIRTHGGQWDVELAIIAANHPYSSEVLMYLLNNYCPINQEVYEHAILNRYDPEILSIIYSLLNNN